MDPGNLLKSLIQFDNNLLDQLHLHNVSSSRQQIKSQQHVKQESSLVQQNSQISPSSFHKLILSSRSNCVKDLNLILTNISQLRNDSIHKITGYIKLRNATGLELLDRENEGRNNGDSQKDENSEQDYNTVIDQLVFMLLIEIQLFLIEKQILQSYRVIAFYQYKDDHPREFKQLISFIPYIEGIPMDGLSEISFTNMEGQTRIETVATKLISGGFVYTQDWLGIFVKDAYYKQTIQEISVSCGASSLRGFAINYNLDVSIACQQNKYNLHIPEFIEYWCSGKS